MKTAKELALMAARALSDKKGREIQVLEIGDLTTLADYFVIATGNSNTQINALCGAVEKAMKEQAGEDPLRREGYRDGTWVLRLCGGPRVLRRGPGVLFAGAALARRQAGGSLRCADGELIALRAKWRVQAFCRRQKYEMGRLCLPI